MASWNNQRPLLATPGDADTLDEVFLEGSEPTKQHAEAVAPPPLFMNDSSDGL